LALSLLEGSFSSQGVNFRLTVCSLFLHGSQPGNLHFFFFFDALLLGSLGSFTRCFALVILYNFLLLVDFFLAGLLFLLESDLVGSFNFSYHFQISNTLLLRCFYLSLSQGFDLSGHLLLLFSK
jgi:hypothetical protein